MQVYNKMVKKETIQSLIDENKGKKRKQSLINDLVRLDQGNSFGVKRADTIYFITWNKITQGRDITHNNFVCDYIDILL